MQEQVQGADMSRGARLARHGAVATALALCGDRRLRELVDAAVPAGAGIGGRTVLLEVDGTPVFVKQVPLTDLERRPEHVRSTANLFGLPLFCQYGVGSIGAAGFGAWRELAVHEMTTNWVIAGAHEGFPLMHHARMLSNPPRPLPAELSDVDRAVAYWGGGSAVRQRIEAIRQSTASLLLFLEYIPRNLHDWLGDQVAAGAETTERAVAMVDAELAAGVSFLAARGLLHFDAHFENILTDGRRLYFTDFGLASSDRFELTGDEADFVAVHRGYDRSYTVAHLVTWLTAELYGYDAAERAAFVQACAGGVRPRDVPTAVAELLVRYAPVAAVLGDFHRRFRQESRTIPYPATELGRLAAR